MARIEDKKLVVEDDDMKEVLVNLRGVTSDSVVMSLAAYKQLISQAGELDATWYNVRDYATGIIDELPIFSGIKDYEGGYDKFDSFTAVHRGGDMNDLEDMKDRMVINERVVEDTTYLVHPVSNNMEEVREAVARYIKGENMDNSKFILEEIERLYVPEKECRSVKEYKDNIEVGSAVYGDSKSNEYTESVDYADGTFSIAWDVIDNE